MADSQEPGSEERSEGQSGERSGAQSEARLHPPAEGRSRAIPRWLGLSVLVGSTLVLVGAGAAWRGWVWLQNDLTPWLESELTTAINRPVELGDLERLTLSGVRVGPSQIPATATDPDTLTLQAVEVQINPRDLLRRELTLNVVLEQADLYLEQAADGQWIALDVELPEAEDLTRDPWINVQPGTLRLRDSRVVLVPYDRRSEAESSQPEQGTTDQPQVEITAVQGRVQFSQGPTEATTGRRTRLNGLTFDISGTSVAGGQIQSRGSVQFPTVGPTTDSGATPGANPGANSGANPAAENYPTWRQALSQGRPLFGMAPALAQDSAAAQPLRARANLRIQEATVPEILLIVESFLEEPLPVQFPTGTVSGTVDAVIGDGDPTFTGTARVEGGSVVTPGLPEPIQDIQGDVRLQGRILTFENVTARLEDITAKGGGTLDLDGDYNLAGQVNPFTVDQVADLLGTSLPVATTGQFIADVAMTGPLTQPVFTTEFLSQDAVVVDQVAFSQVQAQASFQRNSVIIDGFRLIPQAGGSVTGSGLWTLGDPGRLTLAMTGDRLPADALGRPYGLPNTVEIGPVSFEANLTGPPDQLVGQGRWQAPLGTYPSQGRVAWIDQTLAFTDTFVQVAGGTVAGEGTVGLDRRQWQADVRATGLSLAALGSGIAGTINGRGELRGTLENNPLATMAGQGIAQAVLAQGGVINGRGTVGQGRWQANVVGRQLPMSAFSPPLQGTGSGQVALTGPVNNLTLGAVRGQGQVVLSDGLATAAAFAPQLAAVREPLRADLAWNGQSIQVAQASTAGLRASGTVTPQLSGAAAPGLANVDLNLSANGVNLAALPIPAQVVPVRGAGFFDGRLVGRPGTFRLAGNARLDNFAVSEVAFATPMAGPVIYDQRQGFTVDLRDPSQREMGDRLFASSQQDPYDLAFTLRRSSTLAEGHVRGSDLFATLTNLPLDDLRLPQGGIEGVGTISGTVASAVISGNWREPNLQATFDIVDPGLGYLALPAAQVIGDGEAPLTGARPAENLQVSYGRLQGTLRYADQVVSLAQGRLITALGESHYQLDGSYALDGTQQVNGKLTVSNAQIQDVLTTLKIFELSDFRLNLLQPPDWYRPATAADLANLATTQVGDRNATFLEQLRRFAEVMELQDILTAEAEAAVLPPLEGLEGQFSGTVTAQGALPRQVRVAMDMTGANWLWRDPRSPNGIAYRLDTILAQATYDDEVLRLRPIQLVSTFPSSDPENPTVAQAELNGELSFNAEDTTNRTLRLNLTNLPLMAVRRPLRISDTFDGFINADAALTGSLANPQVRGRLAVNDATINRQPVDVASADFLYQQARLNLRSNVAIEDQVDPLVLLASVPLPIAGTNQVPSRDDVTVRLRMKDQGFALINLFTQAVTWEEGAAELALDVDGTWPVNKPIEEALTSLVVTGAAKFDGVTLSSRSLPEPLTNLRGDVTVVQGPGNGSRDSLYFNGLVLDVQDLRGDFSAGELVAQGKLKVLPSIDDLFPGLVGASPLAAADDGAEPVDDRFRLSLTNIALDLRNPAGTYNGRLDGDVVVDGSLYLLEPLISGNLRLSNGVLTLPDSQDETTLVGGGGGSASPSIFQPLPPVMEDFSITLGDNVRLAIPGVVDVRAQGDLKLVGTVPDIRPDGRIDLPSGRINLLTTEFRLTGNDNYAEFSATDEVIDPLLVASLSAAVSDTLGNGTSLSAATPFPRNEVLDSPISQLGLTQNGIQTIRIRANVNGRASRVIQLQGVELASTPPRSEGEIITLISNEFLTALESTLGSVSGGGDNFQGLLAFAGSAILNRIQNLIGAGIDNTELRLYSASPPGSQQVDVGGEVSFNVSPSLGLSVQKTFTNVTPALFGVRYRITDQITVRGVTSYEQFNENTGAIVEFRF
ncbi:translocation/assembly module TamB domain-containing protein [Leptolyngbya sp. BL0902]|uniref:translocation/assembly module TamB domain-containing protein n=1 Tax=Leptolyngbya sp. BL0902 TaxID=1115757 RepID=UPI0018E79331|nr:translocation/assembly module TamB domain-containing protein [Leptolyngbya sp. BL0902]